MMSTSCGMTTACSTLKATLRQNHQTVEEAEPEIYHAIRRDALLEITVREDGTVDFDDGSKPKTPASLTRLSYR